MIALLDPDKRVSGLGAQHLRDNGIAVSVGIGAEQVSTILTFLPSCG